MSGMVDIKRTPPGGGMAGKGDPMEGCTSPAGMGEHKGVKIETLDGLMTAARERRAVLVRRKAGGDSYFRTSASYMIGSPAKLVWHHLQRGVWLYEKGDTSLCGGGTGEKGVSE